MKILQENFNPGAYESRYDDRDYQWLPVASACGIEQVFDWNKGWDSEIELGTRVKIENQDGSSSCTGQGVSSLGSLLNCVETRQLEDFSAKAVYSQIYLPNGGAYTRDSLDIAVNYGFNLESDVPSYENGKPPSETFMRRSEDITADIRAKAKKYQSLNYYALPANDIESVAIAIKNHWGVILAAQGTNQGWNSAFVRPPQPGEQIWGHQFYGLGAFLKNGEKVIKCPNSWGEDWGDKGYFYLDESYFKSNNVHVPQVLIDKKNLNIIDMINTIKAQNDPNIYCVSNNSKQIFPIGAFGSYKQMLDAGWIEPFKEITNLDGYEIVDSPMGFLK